MNPNNEIVIASALLLNIVLNANANVPSNMTIGNCVNICSPKYANTFISCIAFVLKLYSTIGIDRLSNPNIIPPTINCITNIVTIVNTMIINVVKNLASNIFFLEYGFINSSFIVPLLNSSLTIVPAIITTITIINKLYWFMKFSNIPLKSSLLFISTLFSNIYLFSSTYFKL